MAQANSKYGHVVHFLEQRETNSCDNAQSAQRQSYFHSHGIEQPNIASKLLLGGYTSYGSEAPILTNSYALNCGYAPISSACSGVPGPGDITTAATKTTAHFDSIYSKDAMRTLDKISNLT